MSKYFSTNPNISTTSKKSQYDSYNYEPQPISSSQAIQQPEDFQITNSYENGVILPTKYEKIEYRPVQQTYKVLETITNKTIIREPITKDEIEQPVTYLKPIYKQTVLDSNPKDIRVIKNKTIVLNYGEEMPDLENMELMPSVIAQNYDEGHKILHDAGLTESTISKVNPTKYHQKSTTSSKISTKKNDNNNLQLQIPYSSSVYLEKENKKNNTEVKYEMGVGDAFSASSYEIKGSKNNAGSSMKSKPSVKVKKIVTTEPSVHVSKHKNIGETSVHMSQQQSQNMGGMSTHKSKTNDGFTKSSVHNSQPIVTSTISNKGGIPSVHESQQQHFEEASVHMSKQEINPSVHMSQQKSIGQSIGEKSVHMSRQGINPSVHMSQQQSIVENSVHMSKKGINPSVHVSQQQPIIENSIHMSRQKENPSVHMSKQDVNPSVHISQVNVGPSVHMSNQGNNSSVHMSNQDINPSVHMSNQGINPSIHMSNQGINPSVHMSNQGNKSSVYVSQKEVNSSVHMSKQENNPSVQMTQTKVGPSVYMSNQEVESSVHMSQQGINPSIHKSKQGIKTSVQMSQPLNPSVNIVQGVQYSSQMASKNNNNQMGGFATSLQNSQHVVGSLVHSSNMQKENESPVVSNEIGSVINPGMTSFPVGPSGKEPTSTLAPNPFENPFSTIKNNRPSDPMNFPNPFKNDSDKRQGLKKSSDELFK